MTDQDGRAHLRAAVDQARRQRLTAAVEERRRRTTEVTPQPGDHSDPVRNRPQSAEERRAARREAATSLADPALAVAPHVVKLIHPEAGERLEQVVQAVDRTTGGNTDGLLAAGSAAVSELQRRAHDGVEAASRRAEERRYPAQNIRPRRQR